MKELVPGTKFYMNTTGDILMNTGYARYVGKRLTVVRQRKDGLYEASDSEFPGIDIVLPRKNIDVCSDQ